MILSDQKLSAFLDRELPEQDMEAVREAIAKDAGLANRLADLSTQDQLLKDTYSSIDNEPLPGALLQKLEAITAGGDKVMPLPRLRRGDVRRRVALVAGISLALGIGIGQQLPGQQPDNWSDVALQLEQAASGEPKPLPDGQLFEARMTFNNADGNYCRLYRLRDSDQIQNAIACRVLGQWQLQSGLVQRARDAISYQPAAGDPLLDHMLDANMAGAPLNVDDEQALLQNRWQDHL